MFGDFDIRKQVGGTAYRVYSLLNSLSLKGHECWYLRYSNGPDETYRVDGINCVDVSDTITHALVRRWEESGMVGFFHAKTMVNSAPKISAVARRLIRKSDIVHVESLWSGLSPLVYAKIYGKPSVLGESGLFTQYALRLMQLEENRTGSLRSKIYFDLLFWQQYFFEKAACALASKVLVASDQDRKILNKSLGVSMDKIEVVPNGVDTAVFDFNMKHYINLRRVLKIDKNDPVIFFVGSLKAYANRLAVKYIIEELAPKIHEKHPRTHFLIVGEYDNRICDSNDPRIIFTDYVNDIVRYINASDLCIAPLKFGFGTHIRLLCYLSCSKPVVTTPIGAEGLEVKDGWDVMVKDFKSFPSAVMHLLEERIIGKELGVRGRKTVERLYDWRSICNKLERINNELIAHPKFKGGI